MAIDRKALLDTAWAGRGTVLGSMVPPTDPWYEDLSGYYPYDPVQAKTLLAEAGQSNLTMRLRIANLRGSRHHDLRQPQVLLGLRQPAGEAAAHGGRRGHHRRTGRGHAPGRARFGIVGESGSGKSTLVRLLAGLDRPTSGEIRFDGRRIDGLPEKKLGFPRSALQVVFQDPMGSLDPRMRFRDIICEPLGRTDPERVAELMTAVGLPEDAGSRYPHQTVRADPGVRLARPGRGTTGVRHGRRDAPRRTRRAGRRRPGLRGPAASLHAGADRGGAELRAELARLQGGR